MELFDNQSRLLGDDLKKELKPNSSLRIHLLMVKRYILVMPLVI